MPIYEYLCRSCRTRSSILVMSISNPAPTSCQHCGGTEMERLLSRFASPKSEEARLESMTNLDSLGDLDEQDPASAARMIKKMSAEMGEEAGDEMEAMMDQAGTDGNMTGDTDSL